MRIVLATTLRKLDVELDAATTTTPVQVHVSYNHWYADDVTASGHQNTTISTTTITTVCDAPASAMPKEVVMVNIYNPDTADHVVTLYYNDNGTRYIIWKGTIASGSTYTQSSTGAGMVTDDTGSALWGGSGGGGGGGGAPITYRYFRLNITDWSDAGSGVAAFVKEFTLRVGATTYPTAKMTAVDTPSPLVATADSAHASHPAWHAFNNNIEAMEFPLQGINYPSEYWSSGTSGASHWLQIDLGAGNEIAPTAYTLTLPVITSPNLHLKEFELWGSNTGAFAGEEDVLDSQAGLVVGDWDFATTAPQPRPKLFVISAHAETGYRYFRVYVDHWVEAGNVDGEGTNPVRIQEFEIQAGGTDYPTSAVTALDAPSPYVVWMGSMHNSFPADNAFDKDFLDNAGRYIIEAGVARPKWLQIDMGSGVTLTPDTWEITPDSAVSLSYYITAMRLYGSVYGTFDGEEVLLDTETGLSGWVNNTAKTFTI